MNDYGMHGWGMGWWWIVGIILVSLIVWMIVRSSSQNNANGSSVSKSALDILKERYANGEIDEKKFESKKKQLM